LQEGKKEMQQIEQICFWLKSLSRNGRRVHYGITLISVHLESTAEHSEHHTHTLNLEA